MIDKFVMSEKFTDPFIREGIKYPGVVVRINSNIAAVTFNVLKNSVDLTQGDHMLYIELEGKLIKIGKIQLNIDNIFKIKRILSSAQFFEITEEGTKYIDLKDLINTIILGE